MTKIKKILVTGGCGFVGRHLIKELSKESNIEVWIIDDLSNGKHPQKWGILNLIKDRQNSLKKINCFRIKNNLSNKLIFIKADLISILLSELKKQPNLGYPKLPHFDEVYHLASVVGGRSTIEGDPLKVGIDLAIDSCFFLWAVKINKPLKILYTSSSAAYPISKQKTKKFQILKENMINFDKGFFQPDFTYGWSKLTGEYLARTAVKKYGLKVAIVRPFSGYGEDQDISYPVPAIALRVVAHQNPVKVWGDGNQGRDFVYIDDCVKACILACRKISDGSAVNISTGKLTTFKELAYMMIKIEGYNAKVVGVKNKPVGVAKRCGDPLKAKKVLNWFPLVSLEEGLKKVLRGAKKRLATGILPPG